ncbi:MAG: hypothetical protein ABSG31_13995 [Tepidisphaeraceae bacterium]
MFWILNLILTGYFFEQNYKSAKRQGLWSWKEFFVVLLGAGLICAISIPMMLLAADEFDAGKNGRGAALMVAAGVVGLGGIVELILRARAWGKMQVEKAGKG